MLPVREVMTRQVVSVAPDATVDQVIELLLRHHVSGVPVLDTEQRLLGVVTEFDLLEALYDQEIGDQPVSAHMTRDPLCVAEDTPLVTVADVMLTSRVRRLPVVSGERMVGLVSRHDLIRVIQDLRRRVTASRAKDGPVAQPNAAARPLQ